VISTDTLMVFNVVSTWLKAFFSKDRPLTQPECESGSSWRWLAKPRMEVSQIDARIAILGTCALLRPACKASAGSDGESVADMVQA